MWRNCAPACRASPAVAPPRRIATLSVHTSPLHQPGTGDAGGMNVYIVEVARAAGRGRRRGRDLHPGHLQRPAAGGRAGPRGARSGTSSPARSRAWPRRTCRPAVRLHRTACCGPRRPAPPGYYDLVHSHYWLSGQVGWLAKDRWGVPLVHTAHTLAKVKNAAARRRRPARADGPGDRRGAGGRRGRPAGRQHPDRGPRADRPYDADPDRVAVVAARRRPGPVPPAPATPRPAGPRAGSACPSDGHVVAFVGRIQPLKAPDVLLRALRRAARARPGAGRQVTVVIVGGPSGTGLDRPTALIELAASLGVADSVRFLPPQAGDDLADALPGRRPGRGAVAQRVVRPGRAGGAGLRHAGGRRRRRRPGHRGPRRGQRGAGRRPRPGRLGAGARPACSPRPAARPELGRGRGRARPRLLLGPHGRRAARRLP